MLKETKRKLLAAEKKELQNQMAAEEVHPEEKKNSVQVDPVLEHKRKIAEAIKAVIKSSKIEEEKLIKEKQEATQVL